MKQVVQNLGSGVLELLDVPCPQVGRGHVLIATRASVISAGTERMLVEFGQANLLAKARQQPDRVRQVLDKVKTDGLLPTLEAVFARLDEPLPLGYCNAGIVLEVGSGIEDLQPGDRVASNGGHAEIVNVPRHLCAKIPDGLPEDQACWSVLGAIALQGIRLTAPQLGENVAVFGLGLVGLLTTQMLLAAGCRVLALDLNAQRLELAERFGATPVHLGQGADSLACAEQFTQQRGLDAVIIAASAKGDDIVNQAAQMTRKRGRIVQVGATQLNLNRTHFYEKEISFQVSCSYGPGRYDPSYEQGGIDYPYGFVRWTEQRNIEAVLQLIDSGRLDVASLITSRIPIGDASRAYQLVTSDRSQLGIVLEYPKPSNEVRKQQIDAPIGVHTAGVGRAVIGFIGAGNFAKQVLIPAFCGTNARLEWVASRGGVSAAHAARKFGIRKSTTDYRNILEDDQVNTVVITTRHGQHASMVAEALTAGKHVFVEKPLAVDLPGLRSVEAACQDAANESIQLMVGFNRRFAPLIQKANNLLAERSGPLCMIMQVNAGMIPPDHWVHDPVVGGGRVIGEGCHWLDLLTFLAGAPIESVKATQVGRDSGAATRNDHMSIGLAFGNGSIGTVHYFANGNKAYPKETLTVYSQGRILELDNFRTLKGFGFSKFRKARLLRQDKGHTTEVKQFVQRISQGGPPLISREDLVRVTEASFEAHRDALLENKPFVDTASACEGQGSTIGWSTAAIEK